LGFFIYFFSIFPCLETSRLLFWGVKLGIFPFYILSFFTLLGFLWVGPQWVGGNLILKGVFLSRNSLFFGAPPFFPFGRGFFKYFSSFLWGFGPFWWTWGGAPFCVKRGLFLGGPFFWRPHILKLGGPPGG